ncbi:MAG: hypothetical protein MAGBODY4_00901 [Candidatus Marinimicrobia bacterium]|nr:hypothetical protein [Candidatus Neomarinimicrobiota bacterium]
MKNFGFVLAAYSIIWGLLALYLGSITVKMSRLRKEYTHLKEYLTDTQ